MVHSFSMKAHFFELVIKTLTGVLFSCPRAPIFVTGKESQPQ